MKLSQMLTDATPSHYWMLANFMRNEFNPLARPPVCAPEAAFGFWTLPGGECAGQPEMAWLD